jgi:hypothetical protein
VGVAVAAVGISPVSANAETVPPDLGGEVLYASGLTWFNDPDAVVTTSYHCDENGGSVTFSASGTATGPYPGTFTEDMTVTVGPDTSTGQRQIVSVNATFTIDSAVADVSGSKTLDPSIQPASGLNFGSCYNPPTGDPSVWFTESFEAHSPQLRYTAFIRTSDATYVDSGTANLFFVTFYIVPGSIAVDEQEGLYSDGFEQDFRTDGNAPVLAAPTDTAQCKNDGWRALGFRNQGQCVSHVASEQRGGG